LDKESMDVVGHEKEQLLVIRRWSGDDEVFIAFYLGADEVSISFALPAGQWRKVLDSEDGRWQGKGSSLPAQMNSDGEILLRLKPKSFFVLSTAAEV
jgi:hypothetical protein